MSRDAAGEAGGRRALFAALAANLGIAGAKVAAFVFTGSVVMLAEAAHSLADSSKQLLLFVGRLRSRRDADRDHPLGYGPERYFWAFLVAILLFPIGALWAGIESFDQLRDPQPIAHAGWAAGVLLIAGIFEALSLRVAVRETRKIDPGRSLWRYVRRARNPDLPSVLLEDAGAVAGAALGLVFLLAATWTGDARWDAAGGFAVALLLLVIGAILTVEFKSLLIGEAALPEDRAAMEAAIAEHPKVRSVLSLRTLHLAPDQVLVLARVALDPELDVRAVAAVVECIQHDVDDAVAYSTVVRVEPKPAPRGARGTALARSDAERSTSGGAER